MSLWLQWQCQAKGFHGSYGAYKSDILHLWTVAMFFVFVFYTWYMPHRYLNKCVNILLKQIFIYFKDRQTHTSRELQFAG